MKKLGIALLSLFILGVGIRACGVPDGDTKNDAGDYGDEAKSSEPTFGQPYKTEVSYTSGETFPLVVTVSAPTAFEPTRPKDAPHDYNVYFTVTIENPSKKKTFTADFVVSNAISGLGSDDPGFDEMTGDGKEGEWICDSDQDICGIDGSPDIKPGESLTYKDGFSVHQLDGITYKMEPAGMAGDTLYFQQ